MGEVLFPWSQIKSAQVIPAVNLSQSQPDQSEEKTVQWKIISTSGLAIELYDLSDYFYDVLEFQMQGFIIMVSPPQVQSIENMNDGNFTTIFPDGESFKGLIMNSEDEIRGVGPWGQVSIPLTKTTKILRIAQPQGEKVQSNQDNESMASIVSDDRWIVESIFGAAISAWELDPLGYKFFWSKCPNDQLERGSLWYAYDKGLKLQAIDEKMFVLEGGSLGGKTNIGSFRIPIQNVASIQSAHPLNNSMNTSIKKVATIQYAKGLNLDALDLSFSAVDSYTSWLYGFTELQRLGLGSGSPKMRYFVVV